MRLDSKGRVSLPARLRRMLGLREGSLLRVEVDEEGRIVLEPVGEEPPSRRYYGVFRVERWPHDVDEAVEEAVAGQCLGDM